MYIKDLAGAVTAGHGGRILINLQRMLIEL
jgi:hypothetical protein